MKVTNTLLRGHGARKDLLNWFDGHFPDGCEWDDMDFGKFHDCPDNYIWWLYNNIKRDDRLLLFCGVNRSNGVNESYGVNKSNGVNGSGGVAGSDGVNESNGVGWSDDVTASNGVNWSHGVGWSGGVNESRGVNRSYGVNGSFGILDCYGVDSALFLADKPQICSIFAVEVSRERYNSVFLEIYERLNGWVPTFNNIKTLYLKNGNSWNDVPIANAEELQKEEAWADMPKAAVEYIASLPEFNAAMFFEITGIRIGELNNY